MVMHIHRMRLVMMISPRLTKRVKGEEIIALIFIFSSTFFILVNYCFGVYVVHHFYYSGFLYWDLGMVQFYKVDMYSDKMQHLNHCPCETSFQVQLYKQPFQCYWSSRSCNLANMILAFPLKDLRDLAVPNAWASSLCAMCRTGR